MIDASVEKGGGATIVGELAPPPFPLPLLEPMRAFGEFAGLVAGDIVLRAAPGGDGHPVIVLPGFLTGDRATSPLRRFLSQKGYSVSGWKLGRNMGPASAGPNSDWLASHVDEIHRRAGRRVSLVGWSLGGVLARELAKRMPDAIRQVITLGSPISAKPQSSSIAWLYARLGAPAVDSAEMHVLLESLPAPPAATPSTAIYSRTDGIVPWRGCMEPRAPNTDNIEVYASHCGLGVNPFVYFAIADRLALPERRWAPFERQQSRWRRLAFPSSGHVEVD